MDSSSTESTGPTRTGAAGAPEFDAAGEHAREANELLHAVGREVTSAYIDGVEKYIADLVQFERTLAGQTQVEGVASLLDTHA